MAQYYGSPQLSWQNKITHGKIKELTAKLKELTAKLKELTAK